MDDLHEEGVSRSLDCFNLPGHPDASKVYCLLPHKADSYWSRVDRNLGWITRDEQEHIRGCTVGVAGCGGMGGQLAEKLLRLGVGRIKIADCEVFDESNINRQFAANKNTIGISKAFATARMLREISDDCELIVFPQGITKQTALSFVQDCDVICDEVEFFALMGRILLHQAARQMGVSVFNCNTVGFGSRLFLFTPEGYTMEKLLGLDYQAAATIEQRIKNRSFSPEELQGVVTNLVTALVPELPEYCENPEKGNIVAIYERLVKEGKASILATNPPLATGFVAGRILLYLLRSSSFRRRIVDIPSAPGYLYLDVGFMEARAVERS